MASRNSSRNARQTVQRSNRDSIRWIGGLLLLCLGLFAGFAVLFSFFSWAADQSGLQLSAEQRATLGVEPENLCGWSGARLARLLVDRSFGLFGMLIPVMLILIGVRIIRQRPLLMNHSILSLFLIMILGSLTLGFAFADRWSLCCSTGWGGVFGIEVGDLLRVNIGVFGTIILLVGGWILTGVYINRNFINKVNEAGNVVMDRSEKLVEIVRNKVTHHGTDTASGEEPDEEDDVETDDDSHETSADTDAKVPTPSVRPEPVNPATAPASPLTAKTASTTVRRPAEDDSADVASDQYAERAIDTDSSVEAAVGTAVPLHVERTAEPQNSHSAAEDPDDDNPFLELTPDGEPVGKSVVEERRGARARTVTTDDADDVFTEVDLSHPEGRVVMGRGGLVELQRPTTSGRAESLRATTVRNDGPFTEITVGVDNSEPAEAPETFASAGVLDSSASELSSVPTSEQDRQPMPPHEPAGALQTASATTSAPAAATAVSTTAAAATEGVVVTVEANEAKVVDARTIPTESYDPLKDLVNYRKPPVTLLEDYISDEGVSDEEIFENKTRIEETLKYFGIPIQRIKATVGPTVTLYEIVQAQGVKISKIQGLQNDIAQSLKAESGIRIIAPIPGRGTIGIEVPNRHKQVVSMYSAVRSLRFQESKAELPVVIGRTIQNENYVFDLTKMPHLLVAGATGQGKSVGLNAIITSLLYRKHPAQLKFVMIDPKMVEFSLYAKIERHFLAKMESEDEAIVTDPRKAVYTLNSLCLEMDNRLELCKKAGARNISEYNAKFVARQLNPMNGHRYLPYIVVVIDEFADLIMTAKEVETPVTRLAQKARAIGIHLIIATQRPSVDVITGKIKANFPARIAFRVMQMTDSRTIIDRPGADQLIGRGDMLISKDGELTRIQCALVETKEVERIVDYISKQQGYTSAYALPDYTPESAEGSTGPGGEESSAPVKYDTLFAEIAREAVSSGQISTSMIQRNYEVGFNRAGRIMMQLERAGIVGRQQGAKPRDILYHDLPSLEAKLQDLGLF